MMLTVEMLRKWLDSGFFFKVKPEGSIVFGYVSFWQSGEGRAGNHQQMDSLLSNKTELDHLINEWNIERRRVSKPVLGAILPLRSQERRMVLVFPIMEFSRMWDFSVLKPGQSQANWDGWSP